MPDLGERGNVMGPQPIGRVAEPPPAMLAAAENLIRAIMNHDRAAAETMTSREAVADVARIFDATGSCAYDKFEVIARARVAKHHYFKVQLSGGASAPSTIQFRLGEENGHWTVREIANLTGRRSGWTR
ncbi:MAG: hypothetical protein Q7S58_08530 [Candidatus Binatus sp.]|uniref:hypothetical protein n=1 Tax=Candidatus Binatus sp. TaxID=2811406 RepID=UPI002722BBD7|nr:hypothetical protein [Candidatus Binatus sp.]MDO8432438.1 hypothetical protein [Candidatus Binatus sp.]